MIKKGIRLLGVDDAPPQRSKVLVVGVVWRSGQIDGVLSTSIRKDGGDATRKLAGMMMRSRFHSQIHIVLLHSIMFGGFNVVDINELAREIRRPVIAVIRRRPDMGEVWKAVAKVGNSEGKRKLIEKAGEVLKLGKFYGQIAGISENEAAQVLERFVEMPAPIRLAHVIAGGIVRGESYGRS